MVTYEELMSAELGISTKSPWQCGGCKSTEEINFYYIKNKSISNEINVRCQNCVQQITYLSERSTKLTDKEVFLIKLRNDFN